MITLHHLAFSRSLRVLWLLEELGIEYELVKYERNASFRAPPELATVHPLGKAPVIVDGDLVLAESSAILRYLEHRYGTGMFIPATSTARAAHDEWLDYVESSAALPILMMVLGKRTGGLSEKMEAFAQPELVKTLRYIADGVRTGGFLMGQQLTLADMQMTYILEVAHSAGLLSDYPEIVAYIGRLRDLPGFRRAVDKGGPMSPTTQ